MHMFKLFLAASASLAITACASAPAALSTLSPEAALVQRQLDAYNAHDLEAFIATYSPEIEIFDISNASTAQMTGLEGMRAVYGEMFSTMPNLRCDLGNRIADGAFVVDREICAMGEPGDPPERAIAIYQVEDNLIRRVWFAPVE
jgi:hypothetical protein